MLKGRDDADFLTVGFMNVFFVAGNDDRFADFKLPHESPHAAGFDFAVFYLYGQGRRTIQDDIHLILIGVSPEKLGIQLVHDRALKDS